MSRIVHIALKCGDEESLENATKFYEDIFGIYQTKNTHARGHHSRHMTDGNIDLALMLFDSEDEKEAQLAGPGPRIHHIGIEVEDRPSMIKKIEDNGGSIYSDRAEGALKYYSADGTIGEIVAAGRYPKKGRSELARISHVTLQVKDLQIAVSFYKNVFDFKEVSTPEGSDNSYRVMTDGETTLTLARDSSKTEPAIQMWGLEVRDPRATSAKIKQYGGKLLSDSDPSKVRFRGPDGNMAEIVSLAM